MIAFIDNLRTALEQPLPGQEAQYRMAHAVRRRPGPPPSEATKAAVLALFYPKKDDWHLVLIERESSHPNDRHGGQIGFPGGRVEPQDRNLAHTALREAEEEVGAPAKDIEILGQLTELYIPVSNFLVYPFVGLVDYAPNFTRQETEVRQVLEVPFSTFQDPARRQLTDLHLNPQITLKKVPYFDADGHVVWGATAMMISELLSVAGQELPLSKSS